MCHLYVHQPHIDECSSAAWACVHARVYSESGLETAAFQGRSSSHEHESIIMFYGLNGYLREVKGSEVE